MGMVYWEMELLSIDLAKAQYTRDDIGPYLYININIRVL